MSKQGLYDYMVDIGADDERLEQVSGLLEALKESLNLPSEDNDTWGVNWSAWRDKAIKAIKEAEGK